MKSTWRDDCGERTSRPHLDFRANESHFGVAQRANRKAAGLRRTGPIRGHATAHVLRIRGDGGNRKTKPCFEPQKPHKTGKRSADAANSALRGRTIREKIIGRTLGLTGLLGNGRKRIGEQGFALAILHQPSGQQGVRVFLDPLLHQGGNLLAEVRGMTKPGEFVALQAGTRCGHQKLPRGLGRMARHVRILRRHGIGARE